MEKGFKIPATLTRYRSQSDNTLQLVFNTQDVKMTDVAIDTHAEVIRMQGDFGWLLFVPSERENDLDDIMNSLPALDQPEGKSPSERLRGSIYKCFKKLQELGEIKKDAPFEIFYAKRMETLIQWHNERLA